MASSTKQGAEMLHGAIKWHRFSKGYGSLLPQAYRKFWFEWHHAKPAPVHYVEKPGRYERNEETGLVRPVQNIRIPLLRVREEREGIWGGEAVIRGFQKRHKYHHRVPHFWVPTLKRSVVRSEILNDYLNVTITDRTMRLIHENHGFDHYLLKTKAIDLRSILAIKIKKQMLVALQQGAPALADNVEQQKEVMKEYGKYLEQYTDEEIEWYGLTWLEAINKKRREIKAEEDPIIPHKIIFRKKLIEQLRDAGIDEAKEFGLVEQEKESWFKKINPFAK